ncbi:hypothetical protein DV733_01580 [Halapricum salinum]|uniref:Pyrrolo-quinoline quinone repeat domain-containing protein n=2 Tax=Halapricum salinum TaxID=1457250 RepID=A0A4D6HFQ8_9EURY|nr:hypothetical protein DV733_01580 [Halapricum salinum]
MISSPSGPTTSANDSTVSGIGLAMARRTVGSGKTLASTSRRATKYFPETPERMSMDTGDGGLSRRSVLGGVAATLTAGAGCLGSGLSPASKPGDWPQRGYDAGHTNYKTAGSPPLDDASLAWQVGETAATVDTRNISEDIWHAGLVVGDGTVLTQRGTTIALDDGRVKRRTECLDEGGRPALVGVARTESYADGVLLSTALDRGPAADHDGPELYGLRPSIPQSPGGRCAASRRWTAGSPRDVRVTRAGAITDGTVLAASEGLAAIDADDGSVSWRAAGREVEAFCATGEHVFVQRQPLDAADALSILDRDGGERQTTLGTAVDDRLVAARDGMAYLRTATAAIARDLDRDREPTARLVAVDGAAGEIEWRTDLTEASGFGAAIREIGGVAVGPDSIFLTVQGDGGTTVCLALDVRDGSVQWSRRTSASPWVVATDEAVYLSGGDVACLDRSTGEVRWRWSPASANARGPLVIADRRLLVPGEYTLYALEEA